MTHNVEETKKEQADEIVDSLDDLFPEGVTADLGRKVYKQDSHNSKGGELGVSVYDSDGNEKTNVEYIRVPGKGSIEAYQLESGKWAVTKRNDLNHNKMDKLSNNDGGES
jgi:hypothetical protein